MAEFSIRLSEDYADVVIVHDALYAYNLTKTGEVRVEGVHPARLAEQYVLVVEDESGKFCGGLSFHWRNEPRRIAVDYFYLDPSVRGRGLGMRVMNELFAVAKSGGAERIDLHTNTFQAPGFYRKLGFEVTGEFRASCPDCPDNISYYMCYTF